MLKSQVEHQPIKVRARQGRLNQRGVIPVRREHARKMHRADTTGLWKSQMRGLSGFMGHKRCTRTGVRTVTDGQGVGRGRSPTIHATEDSEPGVVMGMEQGQIRL